MEPGLGLSHQENQSRETYPPLPPPYCTVSRNPCHQPPHVVLVPVTLGAGLYLERPPALSQVTDYLHHGL